MIEIDIAKYLRPLQGLPHITVASYTAVKD